MANDTLIKESLQDTQGSDTQNLGEAPASASVKVRSNRGYEYIFTLRDQHAHNLMFKIDSMEKKWIELGWEPVAQNGYQKGSVRPQAAPGQTEIAVVCDICGAKALERKGITKSGKPYHGIFCSSDDKTHTRWLPS